MCAGWCTHVIVAFSWRPARGKMLILKGNSVAGLVDTVLRDVDMLTRQSPY